jgi:hypothetical protein
VGEAVVNLIETQAGSVIIRRSELDALRAADADDSVGETLHVMCRNCRNPMLYLRIVNGRANVDPRVLSKVNPTCPHTMEATP